jgi:soluble lytic murein transglycosylase-like protein
MRNSNPRRTHWLAIALFFLFLGLGIGILPLRASAMEPSSHPSAEQLQRLQELEPYVRYFTSLSYGPQRARISSEFIRALILIESGADPEARSPMGARGVAQILPSTGRAALRALSGTRDFLFVDEKAFHRFEPELLSDPAINILIACYLAATYDEMYDGRTDLVVAAWNAGPGAVARFGNEPPPYRETLKLIKRVEHTMDYLSSEQMN